MEERKVWLRLGDWAEHCEHPGVSADLPRLWVAITHEGWNGWANIALHWTGSQWSLCIPAQWVLGEGPTDEQLQEMTAEAICTASATPTPRWRSVYRDNLHESLDRAQGQLAWDRKRVTQTLAWVRRVECTAAVADLPDGEVRNIARRLLHDWNGTAGDLIMTARALASGAGPEPRDGAP